jgi:hypothetical protein
VTVTRILTGMVGPRMYCPSCGEVRHAETTGPLRILPHWTGSSSVEPGEKLRRRCSGGPVDPEEDRAP